MRQKGVYSAAIMLMVLHFLNCSQQENISKITGDYLGEEPPGLQAKLFAPAIVSTVMNEDGSPVFTPDGDEIFWRIGGSPFSTFVYMKRINSVWSKPGIAPFSGQYQDAGLAITPDGKKIYFTSKRPITGEKGLSKFNTWLTEKRDGSWQDPVPVGKPIDHPDDYYTRVSIAADGTLIKQSSVSEGKGGWDLYMCKLINGQYSEQVNLPGDVNTEFNEYAPEISPDGSYIVFQSNDRTDSKGSIDLFVTFKKNDGTWTHGINLGDGVNTKNVEKWPTITPDGEFLFFTSDRPVEVKYAQYSRKRKNLEEIKALYQFYHAPKYEPAGGGDIYWVDAKIIEGLRPGESE